MLQGAISMRIYTSSNHRKIYEQHYGPIPRDAQGRSYEIHHKDGNHNNNTISNLQLVTIEEHFSIHLAQGDYGACWIMSHRMRLNPEETSRLGRLKAKKQVAEGRNKFADPEFNKQNQKRRVAEGTHHLLGGKVQQATQQRLSAEGKHNFLGKEITSNQLVNGTHPSQKRICCIHCRADINIGTFSRAHKDKCDNK